MVFEVLNKLKWLGKLKDCKIIIRHRGALNDRKSVSGKNVTELKRHYFMYKNKEETFIPLHRILEVWVKGKLLWSRER